MSLSAQVYICKAGWRGLCLGPSNLLSSCLCLPHRFTFFFFKSETLNKYACHHCTGARPVFSVSFQFYSMCCWNEHQIHLKEDMPYLREEASIRACKTTQHFPQHLGNMNKWSVGIYEWIHQMSGDWIYLCQKRTENAIHLLLLFLKLPFPLLFCYFIVCDHCRSIRNYGRAEWFLWKNYRWWWMTM